MSPKSTLEECEKVDQRFGTLGHLPQEIRIMIYKHTIAQGSVNIIAASSLIKADILSEIDIFEHGICRLNLNFYDMATEQLKPSFNPSNFIVNKIRNVAIRVDTRFNGSKSYPTPEINILNKFSGADVHRKKCAVSFVCWGDITKRKFQLDVLGKLRDYNGFEEVEVAIDCVDPWPNEWPEEISQFSVSQIFEYDSVKEAIRTASHILEQVLGKAEGGKWEKVLWEEEGGKWEIFRFTALTFHPRGLEGGKV